MKPPQPLTRIVYEGGYVDTDAQYEDVVVAFNNALTPGNFPLVKMVPMTPGSSVELAISALHVIVIQKLNSVGE